MKYISYTVDASGNKIILQGFDAQKSSYTDVVKALPAQSSQDIKAQKPAPVYSIEYCDDAHAQILM